MKMNETSRMFGRVNGAVQKRVASMIDMKPDGLSFVVRDADGKEETDEVEVIVCFYLDAEVLRDVIDAVGAPARRDLPGE